MSGRRSRLNKQIGQDDVKGYRGHKLLISHAAMDQLASYYVALEGFESFESIEHQAWLNGIRENVNRRLGSR